jgi:hypothetical protein
MTSTDKTPETCYTCNSPVLPVDTHTDTYLYTSMHWGKEYLFCSLGCKYRWEGDSYYDEDEEPHAWG